MKTTISCVIIDDEPLGQELIRKYAGRLDFIEVLGVYDNAIEALGKVEDLRPDIIFLDVHMPEMNGIEYLRTFSAVRPHVILTTAYSEYAFQGYENDVIDFILKPITFDRFVKAVSKVKEKIRQSAGRLPEADLSAKPAPADLPEPVEDSRMLLIKENKKFLKVSQDDVLLVEGMKDYLKLHTRHKVIITHMTMTKIEEMLNKSDFLRVNRSFIVRKSAIKAINGNTIELINDMEAPIGISYRGIIRKLTEDGVL